MINRFVRAHLLELSPNIAADQMYVRQKVVERASGRRLVTDITKSDVAKFLNFVADRRPRPQKHKPNNRARTHQGHRPPRSARTA